MRALKWLLQRGVKYVMQRNEAVWSAMGKQLIESFCEAESNMKYMSSLLVCSSWHDVARR